MSKPKTFIGGMRNKKKLATKTPSTVDEYQAAGVELEEAGEKWRAGDAAKALRFFMRAIDMYGQGLQKYPQSLDLAYNKARTQYEIITHPALSKQLGLGEDRIELEEILISHRYALSLDGKNSDTLFNTAQVLTSIAEEILSQQNHEQLHLGEQRALQNLEEALEMFQRCLSLQELRYDEFETQKLEALKYAEDVDMDTALTESDTDLQETESRNSDQAGPDEWAAVVEPVTLDTLLDTVMAQLSSLTTLCGILGSNQDFAGKPSIAWVEEYARTLLSDRLPKLIEATGRAIEAAVAKARLSSTLLENGFRVGQINAQTYRRELDVTFKDLEAQQTDSSEVVREQVESLFSFNTALADTVLDLNERTDNRLESQENEVLRWSALDKAISTLTKASTAPVDDSTEPGFRPLTHFLRGDASLLQAQLSRPPYSYPPAIKNEATLLRNAVVFYRNASRLWTDDQREVEKSRLRESVATLLLDQVIKGDTSGRKMFEDMRKSNGDTWLQKQVNEMISEGVLGERDLQAV